MRKFDIYKTIQLIVFILLAGISLYVILTDERLYQLVANDLQIRTLCIMMWIAFGLSFLFIFMDFSLFSTFKRDYKELDFAVFSDPVSGIANRYSCDSIIEKYLERPLPRNIGCIMFDLMNLDEINQSCGHEKGNELIQDFSGILQASSRNLCFVGRNGGNKFLALFEDCHTKKIDTFLARINTSVYRYNQKAGEQQILYRYGTAYREDSQKVKTITDLISLANRRIYSSRTEEGQ